MLTAAQKRTSTRAANKASHARMEAARAEVRRAVATGRCPKCARELRRNSSMAGWWQCSQYGAVGFRVDAAQPPCDWQGFTE
jgi:hypothetical protein